MIYAMSISQDTLVADDEAAAVAAVLTLALPGQAEVGFCVNTEHLQESCAGESQGCGLHV